MKEISRVCDPFYRDRIPAQWNRRLETQRAAVAGGGEEAEQTLDAMCRVRASLDVLVTDADGDVHYRLVIEEGRMSIGEVTPEKPILTLVHDLDTFETLERESGDSLLGFLGALAGQGEEMRLTERQVQTLGELDGSLRFERKGGSPFRITAYLGDAIPGAEPACYLGIDALTYSKLESGELSPQDAFMGGQIILEGDVQIAMQVALAALAPE
jgi:hypothetical protein